MRRELPTGTVTLLFSDVEGSTTLLHELGAEAYADVLAEHRRIVRGACTAEGGVEVDNQGDAFFFAFRSAPAALAAAQAVTGALAAGPIQVRIGLHTGTPFVTEEGYVGDDVHLAARVGASAHGGQVVLSRTTRELVDGLPLTDLGEHRLKDIPGAVSIFQLGSERFPPLKTISNTNLPRPASSFIGRERELARAARHDPQRTAGDADGPGRVGEDSTRARGGGNACPFLQGRRLLGRPRLAARPGAGQRDDCPDAGIQERPRRAHRRTRAAPAARQPGAGDRGGAPVVGAAQRLRQSERARDEPRAPARPGRSRVRGAAARLARGRGAVLRALRASSRARRSPSSASDSTSCRSRSSSPPRAPRRSRRDRSSSGSRSASTCSRVAATPTRGSRRCARRSTGATTCSPQKSNVSSAPSRSSPALHPGRRRGGLRRRHRHAAVAGREEPAPLLRPSATGCSRRSASMRANGWTRPARPMRSPAATPTTTSRCSRSDNLSSWAPAVESCWRGSGKRRTTCGQPSTISSALRRRTQRVRRICSRRSGCRAAGSSRRRNACFGFSPGPISRRARARCCSSTSPISSCAWDSSTAPSLMHRRLSRSPGSRGSAERSPSPSGTSPGSPLAGATSTKRSVSSPACSRRRPTTSG